MSRNVWAKVWCDFLRHPRFRRRPDCDKVLALGLILHAKEHAQDGVVRELDAEEMRGLFGIKAPLQRVQEGLEYLLLCGWLEHADERGSLRIKDFVVRQAPDSKALRMMRWRDRRSSGDVDDDVDENVDARVDERETRRSRKALSASTSASTLASPEVEVEEEEDHDRSAVGGESEGRGSDTCESVDNPQPGYANLSESERLHFLKLFREGKGSEATAYLAEKQRPQVPEKIEKKLVAP